MEKRNNEGNARPVPASPQTAHPRRLGEGLEIFPVQHAAAYGLSQMGNPDGFRPGEIRNRPAYPQDPRIGAGGKRQPPHGFPQESPFRRSHAAVLLKKAAEKIGIRPAIGNLRIARLLHGPRNKHTFAGRATPHTARRAR